jgi:hypothetical protein
MQDIDIKVDFIAVLNEDLIPHRVNISYTTVRSEGGDSQFGGQFNLSEGDGSDLFGRLHRLALVMQERIPSDSLRFGAETLFVQGRLMRLRIMDDVNPVQLDSLLDGRVTTSSVAAGELTSAQLALVESTKTTIRRLAWNDLAQRLNPRQSVNGRPRAFISYRKTKQSFAEALAARLLQEGLEPWFDEWQIVPGDSLPGKIEEAFETSTVFLPVLSEDYREGNWATAELETAIAKRISSAYRIIPVLYEVNAQMPELLRALVYVDFTEHSPEAFESQIGKLVDGIYGLPQNPYR